VCLTPLNHIQADLNLCWSEYAPHSRVCTELSAESLDLIDNINNVMGCYKIYPGLIDAFNEIS
jgi:hypothetical protein